LGQTAKLRGMNAHKYNLLTWNWTILCRCKGRPMLATPTFTGVAMGIPSLLMTRFMIQP